VVSIVCFADAAVGDDVYKFQMIGVLLSVTGLNFVAMILARPVMRVVGVSILQMFG
jgi:hypothetical protein